ncbi:ribosomal protein S7 [Xylariaceae sp. FL0594]|nr:ribosomal protein S7 [Xylariaceae sp. FL0594]
MASKLNPWRSLQTLAIRTARPAARWPQIQMPAPTRITSRCLTSDTLNHNNENINIPPPPAAPSSGETEAAEAAATASAEEYVPRPIDPFTDNYRNAEALAILEEEASGRATAQLYADGLKYHMPERPKEHEQLQDRLHPVVHQVTRMIMRDGKLSQAEKHMSYILNYLKTSPPPKFSPTRPLIQGCPPPSQLPLNPVAYLAVAIDSVAPMVKMNYIPKAAGGGRALEVPAPLALRQRRRQAIAWIMDIVEKKRSVGSGRKQFAARFGSEIIAVVEGRSTAWDKRHGVHKLATTARANLNHFHVVARRKLPGGRVSHDIHRP